jgi:hypothetical protein
MLTGMGGYEDTYLNAWGKLIASLTAALAIYVFAIPVGVIADGFMNKEPSLVTCPSCQHSFIPGEDKQKREKS